MVMDLVDWSPVLHLAVLGVLLAAGPLVWVWTRHRGATPAQRLRALTLLTLFFTFDLIVIGATTRLTDSGLGCPDWPGCYGSATPLGARDEIHAAQTAMPTGPVTHGKAWMEMVHRYFAMGVGVLIVVIAVMSWLDRRRRAEQAPSPWWATVTLVAVCLQGAFGALTVTMKLYPAIVTLHLLFGLGLLALLALQAEAFLPRPLKLSRGLQWSAMAVAGLCVLQIALGGWVSTNYAVLACRDFPTCQGSWWPPMDFEHAFTLRRELGQTGAGSYLPFAALTAIHMAHRLMAAVVLTAMGLLAWRLHASGQPGARRFALGLLALMAWQLASGLSNVVLGWPILAAVAHTAGAAALVLLLSRLLARALQPAPARAAPSARRAAAMA
ncbi:COX15/CtaA family protein [Aquincola tertiaricarbonis]|uniref:COX15/CtaA family protein n=1 Tax=Aquincola tertiaricarbonis TaxID=391953 RepID=UPI000A669421